MVSFCILSMIRYCTISTPYPIDMVPSIRNLPCYKLFGLPPLGKHKPTFSHSILAPIKHDGSYPPKKKRLTPHTNDYCGTIEFTI